MATHPKLGSKQSHKEEGEKQKIAKVQVLRFPSAKPAQKDHVLAIWAVCVDIAWVARRLTVTATMREGRRWGERVLWHCGCNYACRSSAFYPALDRLCNLWVLWWMMKIERKGLKLSVWTVLTAFVVGGLISEKRSTVSVVCGVIVVAVGVLTIVLILTGHDPWWTETRKVSRDARKHRRLG